MSSNDIYYTYLLLDPDNLIPFYVGMGKNDRYLDHVKEAICKPSTVKGQSKLNKIRKLLREGKEPLYTFLVLEVSRNVAITAEIALIKMYGRMDIGTGILTNQTSGGEGCRDWSVDHRRAQSDRNRGYISAKDPITGLKMKVHNSDSRWQAGELVGQNLGSANSNITGKLTGYIQAKDLTTGKCFRIKPDDPRWVSGELVGINKGKHPNENVINAARLKRGIKHTPEHNKKVGEALKNLKWYCNFEMNSVGRFIEGSQPDGYIRVSGPHKKTIL